MTWVQVSLGECIQKPWIFEHDNGDLVDMTPHISIFGFRATHILLYYILSLHFP